MNQFTPNLPPVPQVQAPVQPAVAAPTVTPESTAQPAGAAPTAGQTEEPNKPATNEELIDVYVQLRDSADEIAAKHKKELESHNELMARITGELDTRMARGDSKSIGCDSGTAIRIITDKPVCNDWEAFREWFATAQRYDVFPKKLNAAPFKEMLENNQPLPPGVRMEQSARVQIRRKNK